MGVMKNLQLNLENVLGEDDALTVAEMCFVNPQLGINSIIYLMPEEVPYAKRTIRQDDRRSEADS